MVLGSAQYKRQSDESDFLGPDFDDISSLTSGDGNIIRDDFHSSPSQPPRGQALGGISTSGRVRFVDSTIRYHMPQSCWQDRSLLEKALIVLTVLLFVLLMVVVNIVLRSVSDRTKIWISSHVCLTAECIKTSAEILSSADFSIDPCDDFYGYACRGWERANPIPDGRSSWSKFDKLWEQNQNAMRNAIEELATKPQGSINDASKKVLDYYQSCLDKGAHIESLAGKPLIDLLENSTGIDGWQIMKEESKPQVQDHQSFQELLENLQQQFQVTGFFGWLVAPDNRNSSCNVIQIDQGGLSLPSRDYYLKNTSIPHADRVLEAFKGMIVEVAKLLMDDADDSGTAKINKEQEDQMMQQAEGILELETKIAAFTIPLDERRDEKSLYHKMPLSEFQTMVPFVNWTQFFDTAFAPVDRKILPTEEIVVSAPDYMRNLSNLIDAYLHDPELHLVLDNYMKMQLVKSMRNSLSEKYREAGKDLEKALLGRKTHFERWRSCITDTDSVLGFALGALFIDATFNASTKPVAKEMIDDVKTVFVKSLKTVGWMDKTTRQLAMEKAEAITDMIGYPDYILDDAALSEKYAKLQVEPDDYFNNNLRHRHYSLVENLSKLDKPVNHSRWDMTPQSVNAYYTPSKNQIVFPAGLLQKPFFSLTFPKSMNYGAMGVVMGHELTHAFDDQGRDFDKMGNMNEWWQEDTILEFKRRTKCMADQYSRYHADGGRAGPMSSLGNMTISGNQTLGENIADNGGLKASFNAYKLWLHRQGITDEEPLPGLDHLSHQQMFFLSFAQVWCSLSTPQARTLQVRDDPHSPARIRVLGVLSNSAEFASAFQCRPGSRMNPTEKCNVW